MLPTPTLLSFLRLLLDNMEKQTSAITEEMKKNENIMLLPQCLTSTPKTTHENIELAIYPNNPVKLTSAHTLFCEAISTAITPVNTCTPNIKNPDKVAPKLIRVML